MLEQPVVNKFQPSDQKSERLLVGMYKNSTETTKA